MTDPISERAEAPTGDVVLTLDRSVALVAFDLLARLIEDPENEALRESFEHPAELASLWAVISAFEQVLSEPFADDYRDILQKAREKVTARLTGG